MSIQNLGKLYLLPIPIAEHITDTIPDAVKELSIRLRYFFVENIRTARRYLKLLDKTIDIDSIHFAEINNKQPLDIKLFKEWICAGYEIGLMSEAGCPGVADPGSSLVAIAQEMGALVMPQVGPSSILLALMGSGFNGQCFRFGGYLPIKNPMRSKAICEMEEWSAQRDETQIFIETPYRNQQLLTDLITACRPSTKLCIASALTSAEQTIKTMTLAQWKLHTVFDKGKEPCIFLIYAR